MQISSPAFEHNQQIPSQYTCDGENISPPLSINDLPANTKSVVLIVEDPDAVSKVPWIHWVLYNIDPQTSEIAENTVPTGAFEGMTDFGKTGWGGPCPPSGNHRYVFKVYALDKILEVKNNLDVEVLKKEMINHILAEASLIGMYTRSQ